MFFMISKACSGPPNPASASATSGANQCVDSSSFMCAISSARLRALLRRRSREGTESEGYRLWSGYISSALFASAATAGRALPGEPVFDFDPAPQAVHVGRRIRSRDPPPAGPRLPRVLEGGGELFLIHGTRP